MNNTPFLIWFTGLSGAGKSAIATHLHQSLLKRGITTVLLEGDILREGLCSDLGFSKKDREENVRRAAHLSKLLIDNSIPVIGTFISPYEEGRKNIETLVGKTRYVEVYVATSLEVCEKRDPKGLYAKAKKGIISEMVGIDLPYERPRAPHITIDTEFLEVSDSVEMIIEYLRDKAFI